jgi:hypothetical protein
MSRAAVPRASARISWLRRVISSAAPGEGQQQQALRIAAVHTSTAMAAAT